LYTPLYLDWEEEEEEGRLRPAFTVKTSGRPNWQTTRNLFEKSTNKFKKLVSKKTFNRVYFSSLVPSSKSNVFLLNFSYILKDTHP
jgi:hypothetical protein